MHNIFKFLQLHWSEHLYVENYHKNIETKFLPNCIMFFEILYSTRKIMGFSQMNKVYSSVSPKYISLG